jgi:hypothetical protein
VIVVIWVSKYIKSYYGPAIILGNELRFGKSNKHGIDLDLYVPFDRQAFCDNFDKVKNDPVVAKFNDPLTNAFSLVCHFDF